MKVREARVAPRIVTAHLFKRHLTSRATSSVTCKPTPRLANVDDFTSFDGQVRSLGECQRYVRVYRNIIAAEDQPLPFSAHPRRQEPRLRSWNDA